MKKKNAMIEALSQPKTLCEVFEEEGIVKFPTGSVRSDGDKGVRYDLIPPCSLRRLAARYDLGAKKYGDYNWMKGQPASSVVNHIIQHLQLWMDGNTSDDDLAGAAWGCFSLMWYETNMPEMINLPGRKDCHVQP
jgi:hypothetical protein